MACQIDEARFDLRLRPTAGDRFEVLLRIRRGALPASETPSATIKEGEARPILRMAEHQPLSRR